MKANEFVKKFGWEVAKVKTMSVHKDNMFQKELKRLVESWELVESYGGLDCAIKAAQSEYRRISQPFTYCALQVAIQDVESCQ